MKTLLALVIVAAFASPAFAGCTGTGSYRTCYDAQSGNTYQIQKYGNTTTMNGYNSRTGSHWTQNSYTYGNNTLNSGVDADGNSWNSSCYNGNCN